MKPLDIRSIPITLWLVAITAFLAPLIGGSLYVEATSISPDFWTNVQAIFHGADAPQAQYLVVSLPLLAALAILLLRGRILAMPAQPLAGLCGIFVGLLVISIFPSPVKVVSVQAVLNWSVYILAFLTVSAAVGRVRGPVVVISAIVLGCAILALGGVLEWSATKAVDPTWRIFGGWNNPNALAGMLIVGLILSLALQCATEGGVSLLCGVSAAIIALALFLTQSRGGLLAAGVGVVCFIPGLFRSGENRRLNTKGLIRTATTLAIGLVLVALAVFSTRSAAGNAGSRLAGTAATAQSTGFRTLLWKSSAELVKTNPTGTGLSSFSNVSTKPGLTTQTILAHSTLLQLAVEATVLAPLILLAIVAIWFYRSLRAPREEPEARILAAGVRAAVAAMLVDGLAESNFYFFGTGLMFFMLLGLGLQLSADSVSPEVAPKSFRAMMLASIGALVLGSAYFAVVEIQKAHARFDRDNDATAFASDISGLKSIAPGDGESYYLAAFVPSIDQRERLADLQSAMSLAPSSKTARALANTQVAMGQKELGAITLQKALVDDPNNLQTLALLLDIRRDLGDTPQADQVANQMIAIETKPYFQTRSIPEIVPLQTVAARRYLADKPGADPVEGAKLIQGAVDLYMKYAEVTVGNLVDNIKRNGPNYSLADESADKAHGHLEEGRQVAAQLAERYRALGRVADAELALKDAESLSEAEGRLADALSSSK